MIGTVLVLNANFEPINVCNWKRAMGLIMMEKVTLIMNGRGEIRTPTRTFPFPSIIRLQKMIRRPRPHVKLSRREIFRRDNYTCQYWGKSTSDLTVDHITPRHLGGEQVWSNVVTACPVCNHQKGGRRIQDTNMRLLRSPGTPPGERRKRLATAARSKTPRRES